jgi:hypothetical protein
MTVTISGDTGISDISNVVATGNLGNTKINPINAAPGSVIQTVQTVMSNTFSMTGSSFTEVPALNTLITPYFSNSKILVLLDVKVGMSAYQCRGKLLRNGTGLALGDAAGTRPIGTFYINPYFNGTGEIYSVTSGISQFLDSPATTSPCVYSLQIASYSTNSVFVNRSNSWQDVSGNYDGTMSSSMTVMEIKQ